MRPESTDIILRQDLAAVAVEYDASAAASMFIGNRAAPSFGSAVAEASYPIINRETFKKLADVKRTAGGAFNRIVGQFGKGSFDCEEHGLEYPLVDRWVRKFAAFIDAESAAVKILRHQLLMARERRVAALYATGMDLTNTNVTTAWSTAATAVPFNDIHTGCLSIQNKTGMPKEMMSVIMTRADFDECVATDQIKDLYKYTYIGGEGIQPGQISAAQLARVLGVREVLLAQGVYDSANEGIAEVNATHWTAGVIYIVVLAEPNSPLETPSAARTIIWTASAPDEPIVETYREERVTSDIVRVRDDTDEVATAEKDLMAYKLTNT